MREYLPILIVGAIIGLASAIFLAAYLLVKRKKEENEWDRSIPDSQIIRRLLHYATPYKRQFIVVFVVMLISIAYDLVAPVLVGNIQEGSRFIQKNVIGTLRQCHCKIRLLPHAAGQSR